MGMRIYDFMDKESAKTAAQSIKTAIQTREGWRNLLVQFEDKDGAKRWLESNASPVLGPSGRVNGFRGVDRDVTDRVRAEEE